MSAKRIGSAVLAIVLVIVMCMSLSACGGGSNDDVEAKITEYINTQQEQFDQIKEALGDSMSIDVVARGKSLVFSYKYLIDLETDNSAIKETLDASMNAVESTFNSSLKELKSEVPGAESLIVEYLDKDGNLITSREFK